MEPRRAEEQLLHELEHAADAPPTAAEMARALRQSEAQFAYARDGVTSQAFALGYFTTRLQERLPLSAYRRPLLGTGFCGAFTTFSTMQVELLKMLDANRYGLAAGYAAASVVLGYGSIHLGTAFARRTRTVA